jgi:hypothetical protein
MKHANDQDHPYQGRLAALATKHEKEHVIAPPLRELVGMEVCVPPGLDTDSLGTFTGEVERTGTPREVALRKARMGMIAAGLPLGLANEGSFGPHPVFPFIASDHELLLFVDAEMGIQVIEQLRSEQTNFASCAARSLNDLESFLPRARFPSHGLIVRPNSGLKPGLLFKGITTLPALEEAITKCAKASKDKQAHVETDMRAHMNPSRALVIAQLAQRLGHRLAARCPQCRTPGWGLVEVVRGLPCEWCGLPTDLTREEIFGCPRCTHRERHARGDGLQEASPEHCLRCNP